MSSQASTIIIVDYLSDNTADAEDPPQGSDRYFLPSCCSVQLLSNTSSFDASGG